MNLKTDYLIIGSGAMGMAFADTILTETDANIIIVDRYAKPGGHWNVAYPFVTLHQPSQFYGVSSKELSKGRKDQIGLNKGLYDLASGAEVSAYFDEVMRYTFLASGRVQYFPLCNYKGNHEFESIITGAEYKVEVAKKLVDCTYLKTSVPSTHTPNFSVEEGVAFMPINALPKIDTPPAGYVIIGGGKTGIDACLWLLENKVNPDNITWIVSRDAWLLDRKNVQPSEEFFENSIGAQADQLEAIAEATSITDLFDRLESAGVLLRIDESIRPQMFHGATISRLEVEQLRRIKKVIRLGHVQRLQKNQIVLAKGTIPTTPNHIHVDCSASAVGNLETKIIFDGDVITPQTVRPYQPVFSAAFVAYVEANFEDNKSKNQICQVVQLPNHDTDWMLMMAGQMANQFTWGQDKKIRTWLENNRLDGFSKMVRNVNKEDEKNVAILKKLRANALPAMMKLQEFVLEINAKDEVAKKNPQFQVRRDVFFKNRLVETPDVALETDDGNVLLKIDKFAYTANNITYAAAGDMIGYWQFFPAVGEDAQGWGVIPVWGFAEIVKSDIEALPVGDRLFGYFPPAKYVKMRPVAITENRFIDGSEHRSKLPSGYNVYRRVNNEKGYDTTFDKERMLLYPLHLTSFCIWDSLQEKDWYGAQQIIILSASSKTSIGLGYALDVDENAPTVIGLTSQRNLEMVEQLNIYDKALTYDKIAAIDVNIATVIVDMSGNAKLMAALHTQLQDNMKYTINVGLTHWDSTKPQQGIITERSEFFFAPSHIQKRIKDWGAAGFDQKTARFMRETAAKTKEWLTFKTVDGLEELAVIHPAVCSGKIPANEGLIVVL